ncbi:MAG: hypothetical protein QOF51_4059 [Chloroflexota bacterium]|jgi:MFS family permease|nr:hypothetical protein [Chloroflexota bacterium]
MMTNSPAVAADTSGTAQTLRPAPLWTRSFVLLCIITILCTASHQLITVALPLFVQSLGGSLVLAGLVFTSFSATSFVLRPLIGHLTDSWSVRGTLLSGGAVIGFMGLALAAPSLWIVLVANALRGVGWGGFNTAIATGIALTIPPQRRAEASGYSSVASTTATALAPAFALWLLDSTGEFTLIFALAGAAGLAAAVTTALLPRIGKGATTFRGAFSWPRHGISLDMFVDRPVLLASLLLLCVTLSTPVTFAFVPVHARAVGVDNIGWYFVAGGVTSVVSRLLLGRLVDRTSRGIWIAAGYAVLIVGFVVFILAQGIEAFVLAGVVNAFGQSLIQPALMALAIDRADRTRMGKAMATYSMFFRAGEGLGAPIAGALVAAFGFPGMYAGALVCAAVGLCLTAINWHTVGHSSVRQAAG